MAVRHTADMLHQEVSYPEAPAGRARGRVLPTWALVPVAALGWWLAGFLPWLLQDLRTPGPFPAEAWLAVPLLASSLGVLVSGAFAGGIVAGLLGGFGAAERRRVLPATGGGTALAVALTLLQAGTYLADDPGFDGDRRVIAGLCLLTVAAASVGWALGSAWVFGRVGLGIGLAALATVVPGWIGELQLVLLDAPGSGYVTVDWRWSQWAVGPVLAAALVVIGVRPLVRLAWWGVALVGAWFVAPAFTALAYLEVYLREGAGLPATLPDALAAAWQVFGQASSPGNRMVEPWLAAVVVAALLCAALPRLRRSSAA